MDEEIREIERSAKAGDPAAKERLDRLRSRAGLHETVDEVVREIDAALADLRTKTDDFTREGLLAFHRYLTSLFEREPGLTVVKVRGYTPGFCDGDRCSHSQSVLFGHQEDEDEDDGEGGDATGLPPEKVRVYQRALGEWKPVLNARYDTNWELVAKLEGGQLEVEVNPWECGY